MSFNSNAFIIAGTATQYLVLDYIYIIQEKILW